MVLSVRAQKHVAEFNTLVHRIVAGDLRQRLPTQGLDYPFDELAETANRMLGEIETSGAGDGRGRQRNSS